MTKRKSEKTRKIKRRIGGSSNSKNGFSETLKIKPTKPVIKQNINLCKNVLQTGKNVTKKNFIPSQFPKLTGLTQKSK